MRPANSPPPKLEPTRLRLLLLLAGELAVLAYAYGRLLSPYMPLPPVPVSMSIMLLILAAACAFLAILTNSALKSGRVGQGSTYFHPTAVAMWALLGKASALTGSIFAGIGLGLVVYTVFHLLIPLGATADLPGLLCATIGGALAAGCGLWLERTCVLPPSDTLPAVPA